MTDAGRGALYLGPLLRYPAESADVVKQRLLSASRLRSILLSAPKFCVEERDEWGMRNLMFWVQLQKGTVGPIAAILEPTGDEFLDDPVTRQILVDLAAKAWPVVQKFLPLTSASKYAQFIEQYISKKSSGRWVSQMMTDVLVGRETDIDLTTGWLIQQAEMLGSSCDRLKNLRDAVKAKTEENRAEIAAAKHQREDQVDSQSEPDEEDDIEPFDRH